jgi:hypothetical protein
MSILQANGAGLGGAGDPGGALAGGFYPYSIDQSLRFNAADSAYLSRTPSSTSDQKTWTFNTWIKLGNMPVASGSFATGSIFSAGGGVYNKRVDVQFYVNDGFYIIIDQRLDGGTYYILEGTDSFRDMSGWYMFTIIVDTTESTAADRIRMYVNGTRLTNLTNTNGYPAQNSNLYVNTTGLAHYIGETHHNTADYRLDAYLAEVNFVDGTAAEPSNFGETINGIWVPKQYSGSYGTNGFYLSFADSAAIGDDLSGNTNDFTANNLAASDVVPDSPTNNFATWNPLDKYNYNAPSEGNLRALTAGNNGTQNSTFAVSSGKWYFEVRNGTAGSGSVVRLVGIAKEDTNITSIPYSNSDCYLYYGSGDKYNGSSASYGDSWNADGDIIGVAFDADNGALWFSKNGTWQNSATASEIADGTTTNAAFTGISGTYVMMVSKTGGTSSNDPHHANFGQDSTFAGDETAGGNADSNGVGDFAYAPPSGFLALCSANLPEPTISPNAAEQADDYFNTVLYTGNSGTNAITGVGFQPDFVWAKSRTTAYPPELYDVIRGQNRIYSSATTADAIGSITSFDSDGFTHTSGSIGTNASGDSIVAWNWKAGGTAVSNTDGSITSSVSAAPDAGTSVVSYTGTGANATIGHGLASAPEMIIIKARTRAENWLVYNKFDGGTDGRSFLNLNTTGAKFDNGASGYFQGTPPTATVFYQNGSSYNVNTDTYIAYCFHSVDGYSKVGSYVGNGSADGTFVFTNFEVKWLMVKRTDSTGSWNIADAVRSPFNEVDEQLQANLANAESTTFDFDFLSNGFKARTTDSARNASGGSYIYLAFAEAPFKYANAR